MKYRIKQINKNVFIPQCKKNWFCEWGNIDRETNHLWHIDTTFAYHKSFEDAENRINRYKENLKEKNNYPIYYKI
jgi:hypothetical protein